jgi:hypothetical protein
MKRLKQGNTWIPTFAITEDDVAMDCTDYTVVMYIKTERSESLAATQSLATNWTNRAEGAGYFNLTNAMSKAMEVGRYWYEIILYKTADASVVATLEQDRLFIVESLEKDFE